MTAAALKPDLFNHLFATQPPRDDATITATLFSVALHGSIVAALIWAGYQITNEPRRLPAEAPPHIFIPAVESPAPGNPGPTPPPGRAPLAVAPLPIPGPPVVGIPEVPDSRRDFGDPGAPSGPPTDQRTPGLQPGGGGAADGQGAFTVVEIMPALINGAEIKRALTRSYPPLLKEARIGGRAQLLLLIDEQGHVIQAKIKESSGQPSLDQVALDVAPLMRFSPAMNRDQRVKVWAQVPLDFRTD